MPAVPLIIWEQTEGFKQEIEEAQKRFKDIRERLYGRGFSCVCLVTLQMNEDCYPEVWLNSHSTYRRIASAEDAVSIAVKFGRFGWWTLDELEDFVSGYGPILVDAMWYLGFRRHKKDSTKWVRKTKNDERPQLREPKPIETISGEEFERLNQLWALSNDGMEFDKTHSVSVGRRGLIFACLDFNPFGGFTAQTLGSYYGPRMASRAHIDKQQDGFIIDAKNVQLGNQKGIYIKAIKPDKSHIECIWPSTVASTNLLHLFQDLVLRVQQS